MIIDLAIYERQLFATGQRGSMQDSTGRPRAKGSTLSLQSLLISLGVDVQCALHNSGNDAFLCLLALQLLLEPEKTKVPNLRNRSIQQTIMRNAARSPMPGMTVTPPMQMYGMLPVPSPVMYPQMSPVIAPTMSPGPSTSMSPIVHSDDSGSGRRSSGSYFPDQPSPGGSRPRKPSGLVPADGRKSTPRRSSTGVDETTDKVNNLRI